MENIAIIPARIGSKRIKRKNIKEFAGHPIIKYSIEACLSSGIFEQIIVSTDSEEIKELAIEYGAEVPFLRSDINSSDIAPTADVLVEALSLLKDEEKVYENCCCIYPTAAFITGQMLKEAYQTMLDEKAEAIFSVVEFSSPPQRALKIEDKYLKMVYPGTRYTQSQDLEKQYQDAGQFYLFQTKNFLEDKKIIKEKTLPFIMNPLACHDIDSPDDWDIAELKFQLQQKKLTNS